MFRLFRIGSQAKGHYTEGAELIDSVLDVVRKEAEVCLEDLGKFKVFPQKSPESKLFRFTGIFEGTVTTFDYGCCFLELIECSKRILTSNDHSSLVFFKKSKSLLRFAVVHFPFRSTFRSSLCIRCYDRRGRL